MFEGATIQFVVDIEEARGDLRAVELDWPIIKVLGEADGEERDPEEVGVSNAGGVALYIDSIDTILKERTERAKEIVTAVARIIQYFNEKGETAVLFFHRSWETYLVDEK